MKPRAIRMRRLWVLAGFLWMALPAAVPAGGEVAEYSAKAAFLYNFAKFVQWPPAAFPSSSSPFVIGIVGSDPFGKALEEAVSGKTVEGRTIQIRKLGSSVAEVGKCHIVFAADGSMVQDVIRAEKGPGVLTVSDTEGFVSKGGMIQLVKEGSRINLVINNTAAKKAGLDISSKLLQLAKKVQ